jgi:hypothetical protein
MILFVPWPVHHVVGRDRNCKVVFSFYERHLVRYSAVPKQQQYDPENWLTVQTTTPIPNVHHAQYKKCFQLVFHSCTTTQRSVIDKKKVPTQLEVKEVGLSSFGTA